MREDVKVDTKAVQLSSRDCPMIGWSRPKAAFGDFVLFKYPDTAGFFAGRVIGRIAKDPDGGRCNGYLVIKQLSINLSFQYERWVDPSWVFESYPAEHVEKEWPTFLGRFFGAMGSRDPSVQRQALNS